MNVTSPTTPPADDREGALTPYLQAIRVHWKLVLAVTAATVLASIAWLAVRSPDYEATGQILVSPLLADDPAFEGIDLLRADASDSTRTIQTAATLIDSAQAAEIAAGELGDGWTAGAVQNAVEVNPQGESNILSVTAKSSDPEEAADLANTFAQAALDARAQAVQDQAADAIDRLEETQATGVRSGEADVDLAQRIDRLRSLEASGDPAFSFTQRAVAPGAPSQTSATLVIMLALIAGFTLGAGAALLLELLDRRVRDENELRGLYPLPVLARIPSVRGAQRSDLRSIATTPPAVKEAFRTLQVQLDRTATLPRVLMLTSASAGDAKTTCAINLAVTLGAAGHKVILIDFDLRKPDVAPTLGMTQRAGLDALLLGDENLSDLLAPIPRMPAVRVLSGGPHGDAVLLDALAPQLPEIFEEARSLADYVVVDTPPLGEVSDALRLVDVVDDVLVVARPGHTNRASLEAMSELMGRTGHAPIGMLVIGGSPRISSSYYGFDTTVTRQSDTPRDTPRPSAGSRAKS